MYKAKYWKKIDNQEILCLLCPRSCRIGDGQRGHCFVRKNINSQLYLETYGRASSIAIDPIEKKPLYHFLPGSSVFSFGTVGCNLSCLFCQNWQISSVYDTSLLSHNLSPVQIAENAVKYNTKSVAFTYNEPLIFMEYAMDAAVECHARNIKTIAVSNGYMNIKPAREFYTQMDAANIDLKSFSDDFYQKYTDSSIKPVLKLLEYLSQQKKVWIEVTTLLIQGYNDNDIEIKMLCKWIHEHMGPDTPLHLSAFHPDYKFNHVQKTSLNTLIKARQIALSQGLKFVYTGNIIHDETESTICPNCQTTVIQRHGFSVLKVSISSDGKCNYCTSFIPGYYE